MSDGTGKAEELNLGTLENDYSVVGEVRGPGERRTFLANRRSNGDEVLLAVFSSTGPADNNALSHFAADTKLLAGLRHPGVIRPIEGRWIGTGAFAVVSERPKGTTLRQSLATGERFSSAHIASLLQDVNGILAWAREQGIVHRGVSLDSVYLEPLSDRLLLSLLPTPISADRVPDALADSVMIGKLAFALLAGRPLDDAEWKMNLVSFRPDLAAAVIDAVERMRSAPGDVVHPEVADFLSTIAASNVLKQAEVELENQRAEYAEVLRLHRENAEAERNACERRAAELEEKLAVERHQFALEVESERAELSSERAQLLAEREQLAYELGRLQQRRASDQRLPMEPESVADLGWPDVDRRARRGRWFGPALITAGLLAAALAVHFTLPGRNTPSVVAVGADTVIPTPPRVENSRLPKGGFLSQTAAGTVSPQLGGAQPAGADSAPAAPALAPAVVNVGRDTVRDTRRDTVVRIDTAAQRARRARRDSLLRRDSTLRRDSLGFLRPDTLPRQ
jgi:hypothetical protein